MEKVKGKNGKLYTSNTMHTEQLGFFFMKKMYIIITLLFSCFFLSIVLLEQMIIFRLFLVPFSDII